MPNTLCRVQIDRVSGCVVARLDGEVDVSNVSHIERELAAAAGRERVFVVDLSGTEYFDSAGIRLLFTLATRLNTRRQELRVVVPPEAVVRRVLEITDFVRAVPVFESLDQALSSAS
ncbi:MAG: STAS domain-containing protein [Actinomycetota bacterium]